MADLYIMYCEEKKSKYVFAPYILKDEKGSFTIGINRGPFLIFNNKYYKTYIDGFMEGSVVFVNEATFKAYRSEAEALWGTTDWKMDFVPGLLKRDLEKIEIENNLLPDM